MVHANKSKRSWLECRFVESARWQPLSKNRTKGVLIDSISYLPPNTQVSQTSIRHVHRCHHRHATAAALKADNHTNTVFRVISGAVTPEKIDHIEIKDATERNGVMFYHIDVFLGHNTSHIPTIKSTVVSDRPDYQLQRRFSDFANLRYEVWMYAQRQHEDGHRCKYCGAFMSYIIHSMSQPRALIKLTTGVNLRKKLLAAFCNAFVEITLDHKTDLRQQDTTCTGYQTIPRVVEDFFRQDE